MKRLLFAIAAAIPAIACPGIQAGSANATALFARNLAGGTPRLLRPPAGAPKTTDAPQVDADPNGAIVGLWHTYLSVGGQVIDEAFDMFNYGGTEMMVDTAAPATDNVCNGVWVQTGPLTYRVTHPSFFFDMTGTLQGTVIIRSVITLDRPAGKLTGTVTVDVFDNNSKLVDHQEGAVLTGTRINP